MGTSLRHQSPETIKELRTQRLQIEKLGNEKNSNSRESRVEFRAKKQQMDRKREEFLKISKFLNGCNAGPQHQNVVVVNFNVYPGTGNEGCIPAEVALAVFSMQKGLLDNYSTLIDPGQIFTNSDALGNLAIPTPPFGNRCQNYPDILESIERFLSDYPSELEPEPITYLFCLRSEIDSTQRCLNWLTEKCKVTRDFKVYSFSVLVQQFAKIANEHYLGYSKAALLKKETQAWKDLMEKKISYERYLTIVRSSQERANENPAMLVVLPPSRINDGRYRGRNIPLGCSQAICLESKFNISWKKELEFGVPASLETFKYPESMENIASLYFNNDLFTAEKFAEEFLQSYDLAFCRELACPHHMVNRKGVSTCSLNVVNRYAFNTIDLLIGYYPELVPEAGCHYPLQDVLAESRKRRTMLELWGRRGYEDMHGYKSSAFPRGIPDDDDEHVPNNLVSPQADAPELVILRNDLYPVKE